MVRRMDLPFTTAILECPMPSKFLLPQLEQFDGLKDPLHHLNTFKTTLGLQQPLDEILGQRLKRSADHLLTIRQGKKETLRSYVKHFTRETLEVDEVDDKVQLTTFKAGLKSREFVGAFAKSPPSTMAEMLLKAQKHMNAEDALTGIKEVEKPKEREEKGEDRRGQKKERGDCQGTDGNKRKDNKTTQTVKFTPLIIPVDKILMQIKDKYYLKWPRSLHTSPNVCDKKKYCHFHKDHGHYTEDCKDLKE
ncbi:uncharacterized protein LOC142606510 [Castanea sativa]|uniref:uncharacterized protein LOC142606510 n=1 Tax=Castanea sativa TaxID=21020 RepID=UPI003F64C711